MMLAMMTNVDKDGGCLSFLGILGKGSNYGRICCPIIQVEGWGDYDRGLAGCKYYIMVFKP